MHGIVFISLHQSFLSNQVGKACCRPLQLKNSDWKGPRKEPFLPLSPPCGDIHPLEWGRPSTLLVNTLAHRNMKPWGWLAPSSYFLNQLSLWWLIHLCLLNFIYCFLWFDILSAQNLSVREMSSFKIWSINKINKRQVLFKEIRSYSTGNICKAWFPKDANFNLIFVT